MMKYQKWYSKHLYSVVIKNYKLGRILKLVIFKLEHLSVLPNSIFHDEAILYFSKCFHIISNTCLKFRNPRVLQNETKETMTKAVHTCL